MWSGKWDGDSVILGRRNPIPTRTLLHIGCWPSFGIKSAKYNWHWIDTPCLLVAGLAAQGGALGQLHAAYEALFGNSDYAESIGLLEAVNLEEHLYGLPNQTVTVFLPDSTAWYTISTSTIVTIYGTDQVLPAIEFHVVQGYYNSSELKHGAKTLTTISGLSLQTKSILGEVLVGKDLAFVVKPDLYNVEGQVVVHGINQFMLPPELD